MILKVIEIDKNRLPDFSLLEFENKKSGESQHERPAA